MCLAKRKDAAAATTTALYYKLLLRHYIVSVQYFHMCVTITISLYRR